MPDFADVMVSAARFNGNGIFNGAFDYVAPTVEQQPLQYLYLGLLVSPLSVAMELPPLRD